MLVRGGQPYPSWKKADRDEAREAATAYSGGVAYLSEGARVGNPTREIPVSIPEQSPVGSSQSNGVIERAIQDVEGQIRTIKSDLDTRINGKISSSDDLVPMVHRVLRGLS